MIAAIIHNRRIQAQTAKQQTGLLTAWYQVHPDIAPLPEHLKEPPRALDRTCRRVDG